MQPAGDHAPGVGLHGDHSPEAMTESPAHQVGAAAGLEPDDAPAGQAVYCGSIALFSILVSHRSFQLIWEIIG